MPKARFLYMNSGRVRSWHPRPLIGRILLLAWELLPEYVSDVGDAVVHGEVMRFQCFATRRQPAMSLPHFAALVSSGFETCQTSPLLLRYRGAVVNLQCC